MIGTSLSHFKITAKLGEGGMGEVYRATDTKLDRGVALKVLPEAFTSDPDRLARFEREAKVLASLNHPNIGSIYGVEEADGVHALVLELIEGPTLADRIAEGPIHLEETLRIAKQIADALEAAHEQSIIHRDLKPANVKVRPDGTVKVLDFGLAKAFHPEVGDANLSQSPTLTAEMTQKGVILGTAPYMSPEQARGKPVDKRADIWAFGCVFFEMLTGRRLFTGETASEVLASVIKDEPDWKALPPRSPAALRSLLRRCLQKDPRRRLRDIGDGRLDLENAVAEPAAPASKRRLAAWRRMATVAIALLVGMLVGAIGVWRTGTSTPAEVVRFTIDLLPEESLKNTGGRVMAISADGRRVAYAVEAHGVAGLRFRAMDEPESRPVPNTKGAEAPFFSPDGEWVGFFAEGKLQRVSWDGGRPSTICRVPGFPAGAFWREDETVVYSDSTYGLFQVSASGGEPEFLAGADRENGVFNLESPQPLPGGEALLISMSTMDGPRFGIHHLETGERRVLGEGTSAFYVPTGSIGHVLYSHEGILWAVAFDPASLEPRANAVSILDGVGGVAASEEGTLVFVSPSAGAGRLVLVSEQGHARNLTEDRAFYARPRLSPDGRGVAVNALNGVFDRRGAVTAEEGIFVYDVERGTRTRVTGSGNYSPVWAPDGNRIAFFSYRAGSMDIFWRSADGSGEAESLLTREHRQWPSSWSPGGDWLAISEIHPDTGGDIWMLPLEGDRSPTPFVVTAADEGFSRFSPDGRFVAFVSDDSGRDEVYVVPFPGPGQKLTVSPAGGIAPVWSRDGRKLYYRLGEQLLSVDIRYGSKMTVSAPKLLFEGAYQQENDHFAEYDLGPEGLGFVMLQADDSPAQRRVHVVLNWFEELKRLVPVGN